MYKKAYITQLTYEVSDAEKQQAEKTILYFNHVLKLLNLASEHLNIMKTPFKGNLNIDVESIFKVRAAIRRFRDQVVDNFNDFKSLAFKCVNSMQMFSSDDQVVKLTKSFVTSVDELEIKVNKFVDLFSDLEDKDFSKNIVESIEDIQKECEDVDEIVDIRIKSYIKNNILAKNWVNTVSDKLQIEIEKKTPLMLDLLNKRQDQLNDVVKERTSM